MSRAKLCEGRPGSRRAGDEEVSSRDATGLPRFTGGAVGFIGYEFIHDVEPVVPRPTHDELSTPTMYFIVADQLACSTAWPDHHRAGQCRD